MTDTQKSPALFLDRDGVVNVDTNFLHLAQDVVWVEGIFSLARAAIGRGYKLIVVTNQSGIGRGLYSMEQFNILTDWIHAEFLARNVPLDATYCCPYHPVHAIGEYLREHEDRKPSPGMLLRAAGDHSIDLAQSVLVGDRCTDIGAANNAGLRQAFLIAGTEQHPCPGDAIAVDSLAAVEAWIRDHSLVPDP